MERKMADQEKKQNNVLRYYKRTNRNLTQYRCSVCGKTGAFTPVYYEEHSPDEILCGSCFHQTITAIKQEQRKARKEAWEQRKAAREQRVIAAMKRNNTLNVLPKETVILLGSGKKHNCPMGSKTVVKKEYCILNLMEALDLSN